LIELIIFITYSWFVYYIFSISAKSDIVILTADGQLLVQPDAQTVRQGNDFWL